jgi:hypothetical protein
MPHIYKVTYSSKLKYQLKPFFCITEKRDSILHTIYHTRIYLQFFPFYTPFFFHICFLSTETFRFILVYFTNFNLLCTYELPKTTYYFPFLFTVDTFFSSIFRAKTITGNRTGITNTFTFPLHFYIYRLGWLYFTFS